MLKIKSSNSIDRRLPTMAVRFEPGSGHVGFVVDNAALGQVFSEYVGSLANYCTDCSTMIINHHHPGIEDSVPLHPPRSGTPLI
jgi:hypothetical protein